MLFASIVDGFTNIRSLVQLSVCFRDHESSIFVDSMPLRRWQFTSSWKNIFGEKKNQCERVTGDDVNQVKRFHSLTGRRGDVCQLISWIVYGVHITKSLRQEKRRTTIYSPLVQISRLMGYPVTGHLMVSEFPERTVMFPKGLMNGGPETKTSSSWWTVPASFLASHRYTPASSWATELMLT